MNGKKKLKKIISAVVTVFLCLSTALCLYTVIGSLLHDDPSVFGFRCFYVVSGSMEPTLPVNALVLSHRSADGTYQVGDVITFESDDPAIQGSCNTHRVVGKEQTPAGTVYITQGDNNPVADEYPVPEKKIYGKMVFHTGKMEFVGKILDFVMDPKGFLVVIIIPIVAVIASTLGDYVKTYKSELERLRQECAAEARASGLLPDAEKDGTESAGHGNQTAEDSGEENRGKDGSS